MLTFTRLLGSLGASDWKRVAGLASPTFFRVVPARDLAAAVARGVSHSRDRSAFEADRARLSARFDGASSGDAALEAYFLQILSGRACLLDVSREAFAPSGEGWIWTPRGLRYVFEPAFRDGLARVYEGFYRGDDAAFREGIAALGMAGGEDLLRAHIGEGDPSAVRFSVPRFVESFERVFTACRERNIVLSGEFVALGTFLALLFEHLDGLGRDRAWDVRAAFDRASSHVSAPATPGAPPSGQSLR